MASKIQKGHTVIQFGDLHYTSCDKKAQQIFVTQSASVRLQYGAGGGLYTARVMMHLSKINF